MTPTNPDNRPQRRALPPRVTAAAVTFALIVIGYGIAKPPDPPLLSADTIAVGHRQEMPSGRNAHQSTRPSSIAQQPPDAALKRTAARIEAPRECEPDTGATDACIFN